MPKMQVVDVTWATEEEFEAIKKLAADLVADGDLSDDDVAAISSAIAEQEERGRLTEKQLAEIQKVVSDGVKEFGATSVGKPMKVFGVLSIIFGVFTLLSAAVCGLLVYAAGNINISEYYHGSTVELVTILVQFGLFVIGGIGHGVLGIRLLRHKRYGAAQIAMALMVIGIVDMFLETMMSGFSFNLLFVTGVTAFRVVLCVYLSPSLARERVLADNIRRTDTKVRAETKTLGLDLSGKGYIKLDFFNVFWVFVVACFLGVVVEVIFHMLVVEPGVYQDRRGLLFGPFSPIYGIGAVLMTVALNRFKDSSRILIFIACTIIGGAFEYAVSWWMEVALGAVAWDYSDQFLGDLFQGRTCLLFASMFGLLGLWWIRWALPRLLALINMIPWKTRYIVTGVCAVLMLFNIGMTLQALDCWQERVNGQPVVSEVQKFYAEHFDNDEMQNRFQSMTITPQVKK